MAEDTWEILKDDSGKPIIPPLEHRPANYTPEDDQLPRIPPLQHRPIPLNLPQNSPQGGPAAIPMRPEAGPAAVASPDAGVPQKVPVAATPVPNPVSQRIEAEYVARAQHNPNDSMLPHLAAAWQQAELSPPPQAQAAQPGATPATPQHGFWRNFGVDLLQNIGAQFAPGAERGMEAREAESAKERQAQETAAERQAAEKRAEANEERQGKLTDAQVRNYDSEIQHRNDPAGPPKELSPEERTFDELIKGGASPLDAYRQVKEAGQRPQAERTQTPEQKAFDSLLQKGMTPEAAYQKLKEESRRPEGEEGSWTFAEDSQGKPILMNSKTGATRPAPNGAAPKGTAAKAKAELEKTTGPVDSALEYANSYLQNGVFTGPGDEALQEKFFELAKPTTGFRMTQPQMDMLINARNWMSSLEAHARHAISGTYFSDEQRQQIARTMHDLGAAKKAALSGGGVDNEAHPPGPPDPGMKWQSRTNNGQTEWRQVKQ